MTHQGEGAVEGREKGVTLEDKGLRVNEEINSNNRIMLNLRTPLISEFMFFENMQERYLPLHVEGQRHRYPLDPLPLSLPRFLRSGQILILRMDLYTCCRNIVKST